MMYIDGKKIKEDTIVLWNEPGFRPRICARTVKQLLDTDFPAWRDKNRRVSMMLKEEDFIEDFLIDNRAWFAEGTYDLET